MARRFPAGEFDPTALLEALRRHDVDFVVVGGLAAAAHGSARSTYDLDVAYARDRANLERIAGALAELGARLRGRNLPDDLPFAPDADTLERGLNFTFATRFGSLDLLGEAAGAPPYAALRAASIAVEHAGGNVRVAALDHLIAMKEAAGRPHDKATAVELRAVSDELRAPRSAD